MNTLTRKTRILYLAPETTVYRVITEGVMRNASSTDNENVSGSSGPSYGDDDFE